MPSSHSPIVTPALGDDVAQEVLQWIGAFRMLSDATIISYNMQDYDFWGNGVLSHHLLRQLSFGAHITVMTTPPPGNTGAGNTFKNKLALLEELHNRGAHVYVHPHLHAKAYLFRDDRNQEMVIVGSPNLTDSGFGTRGTHKPNLLELALLTGDPGIYASTAQFIGARLIGNPGTLDFSAWIANNLGKVAQAKGAP